MWWHDLMSSAGWHTLVLTIISWTGLVFLVVLALKEDIETQTFLASPREVLDLRLARGEIGLDEYRARLSALSEVHHG